MSEAQKTPLTDLLRQVPKTRRISWQEFHEGGSSAGYHLCPIGRMAHEAADEITSLQAENKALRARVAELESDNDHQRERRNAARDCIKKMGEGSAWLLRKQAEAVERAADKFGDVGIGRSPFRYELTLKLKEEAQDLRTQAAELDHSSVEGGE